MNNIKSLRLARGMSQKYVARCVRVSQQAVAKWEHGSCPDGYNCVRLAKLFNVPIASLFLDLDS